ncbi:MAG: PDZ domain-containing protein, partial [Candidatus Brocadiales bacterium]|nr:PDZ domain-containing protein [Candidatus Brocadiales bacterium]
MRFTIILFLAIVLSGCVTSGYKQFYNPYVDAKTLPEVQLLAEGQEPQIFGTDNFDRDIRILQSKQYIPIGHSSFNSRYEDIKNAAAQAKRIGATIVLVSSQYTNTQTTTSTLFLPDNRTTYNSGTAYGNTTYNSAYGGYLGSSNTRATYSGTSTTYGTKAVPFTTHQRRYDQTAVYLVKSTQKLKFGVQYNDLTPEQRTQFERNTGVLINVVVENSPAFFANVLAGDVLIAVDGKAVQNAQHAGQLMGNIPPDEPS